MKVIHRPHQKTPAAVCALCVGVSHSSRKSRMSQYFGPALRHANMPTTVCGDTCAKANGRLRFELQPLARFPSRQITYNAREAKRLRGTERRK